MVQTMTSKERMLAALRGEKVDHVPFCLSWNMKQPHEKLTWKNERQKLEAHRDKGWDSLLSIYPLVTPCAEVKIEMRFEGSGDNRVLCQSWKTPAGEITEKLKATADWDELDNNPAYMQFMSDFRTSRYLEFPFKTMVDLDALEYLFPLENPYDTEKITQEYYEKRKLADELGFPLFTYLDAGMDWLLWLYPPEEAITRVIEEPEHIKKLLSHINSAKLQRLKLLLDLGIDCVKRRGWYESTDLWSPEVFRSFARPAVEKEIEITHKAGKPYAYIMVTGIMPLLSELASMKFDCLVGPEPVLGGQDLNKIRDSLPGKTIWSGLSGPEHFAEGSPANAEKAVEDAISIYGKKGFILGMEVGFRNYFKWENFEAAEKAWRRLA